MDKEQEIERRRRMRAEGSEKRALALAAGRLRAVFVLSVVVIALGLALVQRFAWDELQWGTIGEWVAGVGTVAALAFAARQLTAVREQNETLRVQNNLVRSELALSRSELIASREAIELASDELELTRRVQERRLVHDVTVSEHEAADELMQAARGWESTQNPDTRRRLDAAIRGSGRPQLADALRNFVMYDTYHLSMFRWGKRWAHPYSSNVVALVAQDLHDLGSQANPESDLSRDLESFAEAHAVFWGRKELYEKRPAVFYNWDNIGGIVHSVANLQAASRRPELFKEWLDEFNGVPTHVVDPQLVEDVRSALPQLEMPLLLALKALNDHLESDPSS